MNARHSRSEAKELAFYERRGFGAGSVLQSVGKGYLPPHQANMRKMDLGKAHVLRTGMANLDREI